VTPRFSFDPVTADDLPLLHDWVNRPHVAEWWDRPLTSEQTREEFLPDVPEHGDHRFIARVDGRPIAYIQTYMAIDQGHGWWTGQHDERVRGIDQFLGEADALDRGLGTALVRQFVERLFADPAVSCVQVDPDPANGRAIRCYEKAGFTRDRLIETPDGPALLLTIRRPSSAHGAA
jgi:RimJ/RimL family protein N-acetyltransferase